MNTLKIKITGLLSLINEASVLLRRWFNNSFGYLLFALLVLMWHTGQNMITDTGPAAGYIDPNIWLLILISLISFLLVAGICWWLLQRFWDSLGLPTLESMVLLFKKLELWQQLGFYWLSFVSLLLAAVGVLIAVL